MLTWEANGMHTRKVQQVFKDDREIVSTIRSQLAEQLGEERFELWFGDQVQWNLVDQRLHLQVPDPFSSAPTRTRFFFLVHSQVPEPSM